jgi:hypothetical protein
MQMIILQDFAEVQLFATFSDYSVPLPPNQTVPLLLVEESKKLKAGEVMF